MHVNPITHNGEFSIGYDANGLTGVWEGVMLESIETNEWITMHRGDRFLDMNLELWHVIAREEDDVWCWQGPDGRIYDPEAILKRHGDK